MAFTQLMARKPWFSIRNWQEHPSKQLVFLVYPYKIEAQLTFLIELLKLPNLAQVTTSTIQFKSRDKILLVMSWTGIMKS